MTKLRDLETVPHNYLDYMAKLNADAEALHQNDFESLHRRRVEDCFAAGTAVTQVAWDPDLDHGRGNIALIRWPIEAFLWDPASENLQGGRAVFKVSWEI